MKHALLAILLILCQCGLPGNTLRTANKPVPGSDVQRRSTTASVKPPTPLQDSFSINPDECLLHAVVIEQDSLKEVYTYLLEVQDILKKGFGFSKNVRKGDRIKALSQQKLKHTTAVIIAIEYVHSLENGHYLINDILDK